MRSYSEARAVLPDLLTRTSYQVGRPWMFEGNRFLPDTGIPIRKIACISRLLALAEPVPLTLASLSAKSLMRTICCWCTWVAFPGGLGGPRRQPVLDRPPLPAL